MQLEQRSYLVNEERNSPRRRIRKVAGYESTHGGLLRSFGKRKLILETKRRDTGNDDVHSSQDIHERLLGPRQVGHDDTDAALPERLVRVGVDG